ncbi:phosphopyruvate hydratase [Candidatus Roizmanbacteria bacterium CG_4_10_14_0_8_um_filter_33_9]|uniref:Enolase n=1 Tax=Candidatus Roizmanbacteria bacterium CG_4_10_14_0_8_um_filter_33_9 TaxID=1974826 RepID=A0A2M7QJQ4_9BACT|nr:MAG: phosphopyruvate hydratase [Candidatus Roizmanbacteria bacterium CG_4_10_14_0_8_um_filter_33_9]
MKIKSIHAQEILDSRGNPTIECVATLEDGSEGWAAVPSGASTGKYEAVELRDNDPKRYGGQGVLKAVGNVNDVLSKVVIGLNAEDQKTLDKKMIEADGTENKHNLGANAILSVSMSAVRAQAVSEKKPLYAYLTKYNPEFNGQYVMPMPMFNVLNGGKHGNWASDIQEYMLFLIGANKTSEAIRMGVEVYHAIKKVLKSKGYSIAVGDEGGFAPQFKNNEEPFEILMESIENAGYKPGIDICLGIDGAASEFFHNGVYHLKKEGKKLSTEELVEYYLMLWKKYPIVSMEDIFDQDDWKGFKLLYEKTGGKIQVMGDDLFVTNIKRLKRGIEEKTCNSILIKLNQIGTISETIEAVLMARRAGMTAIVSHRSAETEDPFIADFVVAMGTGQIKTGAPARSERTAKYNRLMRIERELGDRTTYAFFPFI